jgi:hypothetical protein
MTILAITDIPRMTDLFGRLAQQHQGLVVVSEIHRGIERLESIHPEVVIIQNHLAGLSADILHKHLKSRLGRRKVRFALISTSESLDVELSSRFELILDPALADEHLEQVMQKLFKTQDTSPLPAQQASLSTPEPSGTATGTESVKADLALIPQQPCSTDKPLFTASADVNLSDSGTYELPKRSGLKIISDFSTQLDTTAIDFQPQPAAPCYREQELSIKDLHRIPHLIDDDDQPQPWYRRTGTLLVITTLVIVVAVSLYQNRTQQQSSTKKTAPETQTGPATAPAPVATSINKQPLESHGAGRPRTLPGFIPKEGLDQNYSKDNPGWESYRGQTNEYRIFREKDGAIKAIQIIDRSGSGIQEAFYTSVLKELAGVAAMRPTSSEIKEGYEVRHGEVAGLQLVQYRDAQGGRMRGFVVTWP